MKSIKSILTVFAFLISLTPANAQQGNPPSDGPDGLSEAMEACKSEGKPGDSAFDSCMSSKGFEKPQGGPQGRQ